LKFFAFLAICLMALASVPTTAGAPGFCCCCERRRRLFWIQFDIGFPCRCCPLLSPLAALLPRPRLLRPPPPPPLLPLPLPL
jgi:hypothetical protein